jgi:hypothetical protein
MERNVGQRYFRMRLPHGRALLKAAEDVTVWWTSQLANTISAGVAGKIVRHDSVLRKLFVTPPRTGGQKPPSAPHFPSFLRQTTRMGTLNYTLCQLSSPGSCSRAFLLFARHFCQSSVNLQKHHYFCLFGHVGPRHSVDSPNVILKTFRNRHVLVAKRNDVNQSMAVLGTN